MYLTVPPTGCFVLARALCARPKSTIFTRSSTVSRMLDGLMSLWMTPRRWAWSRPWQTETRKVHHLGEVEPALSLQHPGVAFAFDELHRDVALASVEPHVVDGDDVSGG